MIRAFIAVEIDPENRQRLSLLISRLKESGADVKWAGENQMHLTLKFLGNIEQNDVQKISDALKEIAKDATTFTIQFSKIGAFPNMNRPRVIWLGIDKGGEELKSLNARIETGLEKLGFAKEAREYKVHLTLGRVRSQKNIEALKKILSNLELQFQDEIKIDRLVLFQSTLTPKGAVYTRLSETNLM